MDLDDVKRRELVSKNVYFGDLDNKNQVYDF